VAYLVLSGSDRAFIHLQFNSRGVVACANAGPDTNKSQVSGLLDRLLLKIHADSKTLVFHHICQATISRRKIYHLWAVCVDLTSVSSLKYTAEAHSLQSHVHRVIDGSDSTLETMEKVPVNPKNRPLHEIKLESVSLVATRYTLYVLMLLVVISDHNPRQPDRRCRSIEESTKVLSSSWLYLLSCSALSILSFQFPRSSYISYFTVTLRSRVVIHIVSAQSSQVCFPIDQASKIRPVLTLSCETR
jgi:cyclophilin family peptidyl-prolyl cis-trans isomerase